MFEPKAEIVVPMLVFSIPIIAILGGIVSSIVRSAGRQRLIELAQRERIAAIERGIDPSKLPPPPSLDETFPGLTEGSQKSRAQGLLIGGLVTVFGGFGITAFLLLLNPSVDENQRVWAVGLIPMTIGVALLLSAWLVWPRGNGAASGS
jgi:hypothetical protein